MQTDFPDPVAPAMSRCGIFARSAMTGRPSRSLPSAIGSAARAFWKSRDSISSRNATISAFGFGTSTPTAPFPGIGATMRMRCARILLLSDDRSSGAADQLTLDAEGSQRVHQLDAHRVELASADVGVARR